ncbi:MAG: hypothetical protein LBU04_03680, partial [Christensenellaceae bacterium]|nr:hypothetical protein [Christensenellaceae bacterium]
RLTAMATASYPRFYRGRKKSGKKEQSSGSSGGVPSISRITKRLPQKQSRRIERCDVVCIEDLNMRGRAQS